MRLLQRRFYRVNNIAPEAPGFKLRRRTQITALSQGLFLDLFLTPEAPGFKLRRRTQITVLSQRLFFGPFFDAGGAWIQITAQPGRA